MEGGEEKRKGRAKESVFDESKKGSDAIIMESESKVNTNLCLEHLFIFCSSSFPSQLSPLLIICLNKILSSIHQFKHLYSSQKKKKKKWLVPLQLLANQLEEELPANVWVQKQPERPQPRRRVPESSSLAVSEL